METKRLLADIVGTYKKYGWTLKRLLMRPETRRQLGLEEVDSISVEESDIDAIWFTRPSFGGRQAWELRLIAETQYALFETFASNELDETQQQTSREMERR